MRFRLALALFITGAAVPVAAQYQSESYKFLQAVREAKVNEVLEALNKPGQTVVNTRDIGTGETALHIVARRGDIPYANTLLQKGADPNLKDGRGNTPMMIAAEAGQTTMITVLKAGRGNPNIGNASGETPLIRAVQRRDAEMVRTLLKAGADPDQRDILAGRSARDYATQDLRNPLIAQLLKEAPKATRKAVAGPKL